MVKKKLILWDPEADYARQMGAYLERDKEFPWEVIVYSGTDANTLFGDNALSAEVLLIAESAVGEELPVYPVRCVLLLNESGILRFPGVRNIDKYQEADKVCRELLKVYAEQEEQEFPMLQIQEEAKLIGLYSPVRRSLQTGLGIALGQMLAKKGRVLYLNFESYAGLSWLSADEQEGDLAALLYYLDEETQKFMLHMKSLLHYCGNWAYILPMQNSTNLPCIGEEEWTKLINRCRLSGMFDYIVLDLNDAMQGLFGILMQCHLVLTAEKEDEIGKNKMKKYECLLKRRGCESVLEKTVCRIMPTVNHLPEDVEEYTRGELAEYAKKLLGELEGVYGL